VAGAPGFLWPAAAIVGFDAAKRSSAAIQFAQLFVVLSMVSVRQVR
jgi:hypothetical protein